MRTTITIDDDLFKKACAAANETNASRLITAALEALVAAESRKRLLRLSGKAPDFTIPGRDARATPLSKVAESESDYPA